MSHVLFWSPGEVVPHEAVISEREPGTDVARVVLHANGRVGQPSHDVELGASLAAARVVVCTALTRWLVESGEQRQRAVQVAVGLPSLRHLDAAQVKELFESWRDRERWTPTEIMVDGQPMAPIDGTPARPPGNGPSSRRASLTWLSPLGSGSTPRWCRPVSSRIGLPTAWTSRVLKLPSRSQAVWLGSTLIGRPVSPIRAQPAAWVRECASR